MNNIDKDLDEMQRVIEQRCECCNSTDCHYYRIKLEKMKGCVAEGIPDSLLQYMHISWNEDFLETASPEEIAKVELEEYTKALEEEKKLGYGK